MGVAVDTCLLPSPTANGLDECVGRQDVLCAVRMVQTGLGVEVNSSMKNVSWMSRRSKHYCYYDTESENSRAAQQNVRQLLHWETQLTG